jgi:hypothetical protein
MTPKKVGQDTLVKRLLTLVDTTGNEYKIAVQDPSMVLIHLQATSLSTGHAKVTVTASTGFPTGKGLGSFTFVTTSTVKPSVAKAVNYIIGPFESARFLDVSTGGRTIGITVASTTGGPLVTNAYHMTAIEILPSS